MSVQASKDLDITDGSSKMSETLYTAGQELLDLLLDAYGIFTHPTVCTPKPGPLRHSDFDVIAMKRKKNMLGGMLTAPIACKAATTMCCNLLQCAPQA
jgi:hypothetical protein